MPRTEAAAPRSPRQRRSRRRRAGPHPRTLRSSAARVSRALAVRVGVAVLALQVAQAPANGAGAVAQRLGRMAAIAGERLVLALERIPRRRVVELAGDLERLGVVAGLAALHR